MLLSVGYYDYSFIHKLRHRGNEVYTVSVQNILKLVLRECCFLKMKQSVRKTRVIIALKAYLFIKGSEKLDLF